MRATALAGLRALVHAALHELRLLLIAVQFFTRLPIPRWVGFAPEWLGQSARHFSLVGVFVGVWSAAVLWAAACVFPMPVAVGLSMVASVWLTGAFHEDGLADTFDALGGTVSRERALEIMKDSRIGTYGAVALLLVLGLKAAALAALPLHQAMAALVLAHCASRAAAVVLIRALPYAGDVAQAKAKPLAQRVSGLSVAVALGWVVLAVVGVGVACAGLRHEAGWGGLAPMAISLLVCAGVTLACARWWAQRLGGITGDTLGATQQLTELCMLLAWLGSAPR